MGKTWFLAIVPGIIAIMALALIVVLFLVKLLWSWTIPDLFPGAVEQGLVVKDISWLVAFKIAIFLAVLRGLPRVNGGKHE